MKIYSESEYPQGSLQWATLRSGLPTASEFDALMTPLFAPRSGQGRRRTSRRSWPSGGREARCPVSPASPLSKAASLKAWM